MDFGRRPKKKIKNDLKKRKMEDGLKKLIGGEPINQNQPNWM
jgi:hypothetical protein